MIILVEDSDARTIIIVSFHNHHGYDVLNVKIFLFPGLSGVLFNSKSSES